MLAYEPREREFGGRLVHAVADLAPDLDRLLEPVRIAGAGGSRECRLQEGFGEAEPIAELARARLRARGRFTRLDAIAACERDPPDRVQR